MEILLKKIHIPNILMGILILAIILRIPSFFEPYSYGDEMIYLTLGQGIRQGLTLYTQIFDNKPPLLYLIAAIAGNLFWFRAILAFWSLASIAIFWKLAEKLLPKAKEIATLVFALATTLPLLEGNIANAELFMIGLSLLAFLILLGEKLTTKGILTAGILFGLSALFKVPAAFDLPVVIVYWLTTNTKDWKRIVSKSIILAFGFAAPIVLSFIFLASKGAAVAYFNAAFAQNLGYLDSLKPPIDIPFLIRAAAVVAGLALIYIYRKGLSNKFILFGIWTLFALFAVALSQRPYPHYLIQVVAPASFLIAMLFTEKTREQTLSIIPLALIFFIPFFYKFYHYKTIPYYTRFIQFSIGKMDKNTYFKSFSGSTARNYEIANFFALSCFKDRRVFVWDSDSPIIYALSRRLPPIKFTAPYHVLDYSSKKEVAKDLSQDPPKFIVLTSKNPFPELMDLIHQKYILIAQIEDADIYSRLSEPAF